MEVLENYLEVRNLRMFYNKKEVLRDVSFEIGKGEFVSVLGPSGCGKTTLLGILIGIVKPSEGRILREGVDITALDPSRRKMGIVFQNYALFPHMTALGNVEYALKIRKETRAGARETALKLLNELGLSDHLNKLPSKLSGGQQQRVAMARTLALNPEIMLFDEPMSALDVTTRLNLRDVIKNVQREYGITMIYVTHDQEEAFSMSDRIIVMSEGHTEQYDTPEEIIRHPASQYVEDFVIKQIAKKHEVLSGLLRNGND